MRVDEGRKGEHILAIRMKALTVVERGEKSLHGDPGSELPLEMEKQKEKMRRYSRWDEQK